MELDDLNLFGIAALCARLNTSPHLQTKGSMQKNTSISILFSPPLSSYMIPVSSEFFSETARRVPRFEEEGCQRQQYVIQLGDSHFTYIQGRAEHKQARDIEHFDPSLPPSFIRSREFKYVRKNLKTERQREDSRRNNDESVSAHDFQNQETHELNQIVEQVF